MITIDTINMCSHLQKKLFEKDGQYHSLWIAMQDEVVSCGKWTLLLTKQENFLQI
ncbi:hypothetical protein [Xylanibacter ruminicola]|uniref:hypothetical protein n=1 Tax=Xylanibacter ruminicola TaxID=839 RepID=UPI000AB37CA9|nr:hypothetical protein [Xylanibacter ruminicola]